MAYDMPCEASSLATSPAFPPAAASDESLFDVASRDALLSALNLSLQPGFQPQRPTLRFGSDLVRYNRVEGLSVANNSRSASGRATPFRRWAALVMPTGTPMVRCRWREATGRVR